MFEDYHYDEIERMVNRYIGLINAGNYEMKKQYFWGKSYSFSVYIEKEWYNNEILKWPQARWTIYTDNYSSSISIDVLSIGKPIGGFVLYYSNNETANLHRKLRDSCYELIALYKMKEE